MSSTLTAPVVPTTHQVTRPKVSEPVRPITLPTLVGLELRKMFDTRSGFWLMMGIALAAAAATGAVIVFGDAGTQTFETFGSAVGIPMSILLPVIAILSVTSEWSQRTGLATFALAPRRGQVIGAKLLAAVIVAVVGIFVSMAIGAVGTLLGAAVHGVAPVWNESASDIAYLVGGNVLGVLMGFMLAVLIRNSPGAVVGYFIYMLVVPTLSQLLMAFQPWYADHARWFDFRINQTYLFEGNFDATAWQQLAVTGLVWLVLPLAFGLWRVLRAEVK